MAWATGTSATIIRYCGEVASTDSSEVVYWSGWKPIASTESLADHLGEQDAAVEPELDVIERQTFPHPLNRKGRRAYRSQSMRQIRAHAGGIIAR